MLVHKGNPKNIIVNRKIVARYGIVTSVLVPYCSNKNLMCTQYYAIECVYCVTGYRRR